MTAGAAPFTVVESEDGARVRLVGALDEAALPSVLALIEPMETAGGVVNLSEVTFMTSGVVGVIALARARAVRAGATLQVEARPGCVAAAILDVVAVPYVHTD